MRSELVFGATESVSNRFLLARLIAKASRKLHRPNTRIQDTVNDVFVHFGRASRVAGVPRTSNVQPFAAAAHAQTCSLCEHPRQSVA
jgi:hypothetical protein